MTEALLRAAGPERVAILVVDDEMLVRAGLKVVIEADPELSVIAEAADVDEAMAIVDRCQPRLAIVSTRIPGGGVAAARRLRAASPDLRVVLLARPTDGDALVEGLRAGAIGFLRMDTQRLQLLAALKRAIAGETVVDPEVATRLILRMAAESDFEPRSLPEPLTRREKEILRLVAEGQTNRQIAARLIVAVGTIKVHVEHILGKLGVADRTQAAVRAVELGLVGGVIGSGPHGDDREE
jgi:DNA-binding NarL/FixJ family response regulator